LYIQREWIAVKHINGESLCYAMKTEDLDDIGDYQLVKETKQALSLIKDMEKRKGGWSMAYLRSIARGMEKIGLEVKYENFGAYNHHL